ncbi:MAG TPA: hypothetical protein VFL47_08575, partial [Flavisolibacter sp.]|nr:hypothetical protein [Flavisolibacter sp.]
MKRQLLFAAVPLLFFACQSNKADGVSDTCSTTNATYTSTIVPIINAHGCLSCHGGPSPLGGFNLETYAQ